MIQMAFTDNQDTICAPASGTGGAVSIIRISGGNCFRVVDSLVSFLKGDAASSEGYRLKRGHFLDLDDVLVGIFKAYSRLRTHTPEKTGPRYIAMPPLIL